MITITNPLAWPEGWARARSTEASKFADRSPDDVLQRLLREFRQLGGVSNMTLTTDAPLRRDGRAWLANARGDTAVAIYFRRGGREIVMARDAFTSVTDNVWSLCLAIEAMRQLQRHGGEGMTGKALDGLSALPPPENWWDVLGVSRTAPMEVREAAYRALAKTAHPDAGGTPAGWVRLSAAIERARTAG